MRILKIGLITAGLLATVTGWGAEIESLVAECDSCHGPQGVSVHSDMPTIAGQTASYLLKSLRSYQRWDRPCIKSEYRHGDTGRPRTDMCQITESISGEDMEALSAHYSALEFKPAKQAFDPALAAEGSALHEQYCSKCHLQGGTVAGRGPRLAGQWMPYLRSALKFVPTGEHLVPPMMEREVSALAPEDLERLMHYFASQQE